MNMTITVGCDVVCTKLHNRKDSSLRRNRAMNHKIRKVNLVVNGNLPRPSRITPCKEPRYSIELNPGWLQTRSGLFGEGIFLRLPGVDPRPVGRPGP
jgi:hypothetical protein